MSRTVNNANEFVSWYENKKANYHQYLKCNDLLNLNVLCHAYHAGFGYDMDEAYTTNDDSPLFIAKDYISVIDDYEFSDDGHIITFDLNETRKLACISLLPHKTIKLRLDPIGESNWLEKPKTTKRTVFDDNDLDIVNPLPWYELPSRVGCNKPLLGPLSERRYIQVINPYEEIKLSSEDKGAPISIDDIFCAARGLCCGPDRSVDSFTVLEDNGSTLTMLLDIDNWST